MNRILEVCLVAITLAANMLSASAQAPALRQGVSVQMAASSNATPMPAADSNDAWIVTITADGSLYFGVDPVDAAGLTNDMMIHPRKRDAKLYIKADARAPFSSVERVLEAGREAGFEAPVLLTAQPAVPQSGTVTPPSGLEVLIGPTQPAAGVATVVHLLAPQHQGPSLTVNGDEIPWPALEDTLKRHFQNGDEKVILLKADEQLPFGQVVKAIDTSRATGAQIVVAMPQF